MDQATLSLTRTQSCFESIENDEMLDYALPKKPNMVAGSIIRHCLETTETLIEAQRPCIFKIGYTHCAAYRFHNSQFGYRYDVDKWEKMIVIYAASERISPAFVEGALIQHFKGFLIANICDCFSNVLDYLLIGAIRRLHVLPRSEWMPQRAGWRGDDCL